MRLWYHFPLFSLLAKVTLARLAPISMRNHLNNSTSRSSYPKIRPGDVIHRYADVIGSPESENRFADLAGHTTGWNDPSDGSKASSTAIIRMSTVKQHVGEFAGQRLFDVIHDALLKICPFERGRVGCYHDMPGAGKPEDSDTLWSGYKYYDRVWILDVPYKTDNGEYASNAWLTITAQAVFRENKYPGIGATTYKMAAGVFARATEVSRAGILLNCYMENFNQNSRPYTFCNVPQHVLVALPANSGNVTEAWLSVTVEFNGNTAYGQFECFESMHSVGDFWSTAILPDVAKSMGNSVDDWRGPCVECWNEDERFDVETWRNNHTCDFLGWRW